MKLSLMFTFADTGNFEIATTVSGKDIGECLAKMHGEVHSGSVVPSERWTENFWGKILLLKLDYECLILHPDNTYFNEENQTFPEGFEYLEVKENWEKYLNMEKINNIIELSAFYSLETWRLLGTHLYRESNCGVSTTLLLKNDERLVMPSSTYFKAELKDPINPLDVIGIELGTIVEGSDAEFQADPLLFPFEISEITEAVQYLEELTDDVFEDIETYCYWVKNKTTDLFVGVIELDEDYYEFTAHEGEDEELIVAVKDLTERPKNWYPPSEININGNTYLLEVKND